MGNKNHKKCFAVDTEVAFTATWLLQPETIIFTLYKKLIELGAPSESLVVGGWTSFCFGTLGFLGKIYDTTKIVVGTRRVNDIKDKNSFTICQMTMLKFPPPQKSPPPLNTVPPMTLNPTTP